MTNNKSTKCSSKYLIAIFVFRLYPPKDVKSENHVQKLFELIFFFFVAMLSIRYYAILSFIHIQCFCLGLKYSLLSLVFLIMYNIYLKSENYKRV